MKLDIKFLWSIVSEYIKSEYKQYQQQILLALIILDKNLLITAYKKHITNGDSLIENFINEVEQTKLTKKQVLDFCNYLAKEMWSRYGDGKAE